MFPSSRRFPHFAREALAGALPGAGISYVHLKDLGGRRKARPASPGESSSNSGWRVGGFRGYADYMQTEPFEAALEELMRLGRAAPTAIMCAEALWWRCHRRLIADALTVRGGQVMHLGLRPQPVEHELTPFAVVGADGGLTYPSTQARLELS